MKDPWPALAKVDGFAESASIFSDDDDERAYFVNGTQVAQRHGPGRFHLRLTRRVISAHRPELKADDRVVLKSGSDWAEVKVQSPADVDFLLRLAELAAAAHRPPAGTAAKPPPTGAELARRRRFH